MKFFIVLFVSLFLLAPNTGYSRTDHNERIKIAVLGDSLISGRGLERGDSFVSALAQKMIYEKYEYITILNGAIAGQTTKILYSKIDDVLSLEPDVAVLALGSNDAFADIKTQTIYENLTKIIYSLKSRNIKILLVGVQLPSGAKTDYQKKMNDMYRYLADKHQLELFPDILKVIYNNPQLTIDDKIHPNIIGSQTLANEIFPYLEIVFIDQYRQLVARKKREEERRRKEAEELF